MIIKKGELMENMIALSANSIVNLVLFGLIVVFLSAIAIMYALWKKGKISSKGNFFYKLDGAMRQLAPAWKAKFIDNYNVREKFLFWTVVCLGVVDAALSLVSVILVKEFSVGFLFSLLFVLLLVLLIITDYKLTPMYPYYYDYNPSLLMYAIISLVFGFVNFVQAVAAGYWLAFLLGGITFAGVVLLYGFITLRKFFKREFKYLDLLIYLGALILSALDVTSFALYGVYGGVLSIIAAAISLAYSLGVYAIILFVYDKFAFIKRLFGK